MRGSSYTFTAAVGLILSSTTATANPVQEIDIPPGRLGEAIVLLAKQANISIGVADPRLRQVPTRGVHGRLSTRDALARLLGGTGATFRIFDPQTAAVFPAPPNRPTGAPVIAKLPAQPDSEDIIVLASKQSTRFDRYAGSVDVLLLDTRRNAHSAAESTSSILASLPTLASTNLGPGRNKLFIRGVADSSFNGPTQATVGQFLGDARLTYSAPDPDLNLYDIDRVEVLSGPQGTLYGTGALGGVIRLMPNLPDAMSAAGSMSAGVTTTRFGGVGGDVAAMLNLPVVSDRLAVRIVGYRVGEAGYIDDPARGATDVNQTNKTGGRVAVRYRPGNDWTVDANGIYQDIASRDGQYTLRGQPALTRATALAQPFDNDYRLGEIRFAKQWQDVEMTSSTSLVRQNVDTRYDATTVATGGATRLFEETLDLSLLTHETRLSGRRNGTDQWVVGFNLLHNVESQRRRLGDPADPPTITGVRNVVNEVALFGQYTMSLTRHLSATAGGRLNFAAADGNALDNRVPEAAEPSRHEVRFSPSVALSWRTDGGLLLFAHYQQATRAGGLAVAPTASSLLVQRFETDTLATIEVGARLGNPGHDRFAASATVFYSRWSDIQADLVDAAGLPFTANIGSGRIGGFDARLVWRLNDAFQFESSMFLNSSRLKDSTLATSLATTPELPNVAEAGARAAVTYRTRLFATTALDLDAGLRYVGRSKLGIGVPLDVSQGGYIESSVGARIALGKAGLSLDVTNLADVRGNRFAFGNPFGLVDRNQITPLRPRTVRLGVDAHF